MNALAYFAGLSSNKEKSFITLPPDQLPDRKGCPESPDGEVLEGELVHPVEIIMPNKAQGVESG